MPTALLCQKLFPNNDDDFVRFRIYFLYAPNVLKAQVQRREGIIIYPVGT